MVRVFLFGFFLTFLFVPLAELHAAVTIRISASPAYPIPGQSVTLKARANAPEGEYTYAWVVNGLPLRDGIDLDTITIIPGAKGTETNVDVALIDSEGTILGSDTYTLRSGSVEIVWEGRTYVPPFYRGKPYPNGDSQIILQAIPHLAEGNSEISEADLVYRWEVDGKKLTSQSGYGKSSISIRPTAFKNTTSVSVTAETRDGFYAAKGAVAIPIIAPYVVIYEDKPLGGLQLHRAVSSNFAFTGGEMTFWAAPFFVESPETIGYKWTLNGNPFALDATNPSFATFRKTGEGGGTFAVGVAIEKPGSLFERGTKIFNLLFE